MEQFESLPSTQDNEISLRDLLKTIRTWWGYLLKKWKLICLLGLIGAAAGLTYALTKKIQYEAELSFVLEDTKSSSLGAYAGLASQLGIDLVGAGGSGVFSGDNIIEFLRSRLMVEKTLLTPVKINNKEISLADLYLEKEGWRAKWGKQSPITNVSFPPSFKRNNFTLQQDSLLKAIFIDLNKRCLSISKPDKKLAFIFVKCTSSDETFAKLFTERLVNEAATFFVQTKTQRSKRNVDMLQLKADSIEQLMNKKTYSAAASQDLNLNPSRRVATVTSEMQTRDKMVLQTIYGEVIKNLELARMSMAQETPIIQIVDTPIYPLTKKKPSKIKSVLIGGLLAALLTVVWIILKKIIQHYE